MAKRVRCSVPAVGPGEINGVPFAGEAGALLSRPVTEEEAAGFAEVPGYEVFDAEAEPPAEVRDMGLAEAASALHEMPWITAIAMPEATAPVPGDTNGDGKVSAAEKRAAKKAAAPAPAA